MAAASTGSGVAAVGGTVAYPIVIEWGPNNYSAYCPDVPGVIATGATVEECIQLMREGLAFRFEVAWEDGEAIPASRSRVAMVDVAVPVPVTVTLSDAV